MDVGPPPEIIVTAQRLPGALSDQAFSVDSVGADALLLNDRLDDALVTVPGVGLFRRGDSQVNNPTVQGLSVRAIGPSGAGRSLVLLDGVPQGDPFGGWVIWGALPPKSIDQAVVVRGAGAGAYGAGALTGAVLLRERSTPGRLVELEGGENLSRRLTVFSDQAFGGGDVMIAANTQASNGWLGVRQGRGDADRALWSRSDTATARLRLHTNAVDVALRFNAYDESRGAGLIGAGSSDNGESASISMSPAAGGDLSWLLQAWMRHSNMSTSFVSLSPDRDSITPASLQYETPALGWGANASLQWRGAHAGVEAGVDVRGADGESHELFRYVGTEYTRRRIAGGSNLVSGAYLEAWASFGDLFLSGGLRHDGWKTYDGERLETDIATGLVTLSDRPHDRSGNLPSGRIGLRQSFGAYYVRAAATTGFRPPTLNELYRPFRVGNDVTEANADLRPETSFELDAAIGADFSTLHWSLGVFADRIDDPITNVTEGLGPGTFPPGDFVPAGGVFRRRENVGHISADGAEASIRWDWTSSLSVRAALTYTNAHVNGGSDAPQLTGLRPAQSPLWSASAGVDVRLTPTTTLIADATYESSRFDDDLNTRPLGEAALLNLQLEQALTRRVQMYLAVDNALDADVATAANAAGILTYGAPRNVQLGLRLILS